LGRLPVGAFEFLEHSCVGLVDPLGCVAMTRMPAAVIDERLARVAS
jgi:hypothetical protein